MNNRMSKIVCFGEALIDFLAVSGTEAGAPRAFLQFAGGAPANVAVAATRLGANAQFVGMLGQDMFGDFLLDSLRRAGVGTDYVVRTSAANTALAFVALDAQAERSFTFYRPPAADLLFRVSDFQPGCFADAAIFHVCSNSLTENEIAATTLEGLALARQAGALISVDLNLRPALWPAGVDPTPRLWQMLQMADLVKLARNELDYLADTVGGEAAVLEKLLGSRAQLVIITNGAEALHWYTPVTRGSATTFRVHAIDTTAAGDAFVGGVLCSLAGRGVNSGTLATFVANAAAVDEVMRFGAASGALATTRNGAFEAMPSRAEVERLMQ
jgi:fructokinase